MRHLPICIAACLVLATAVHAETAARRPSSLPVSRPGPPHAWLFGSWTGGLFPVLPGELVRDCRASPTVVFQKDSVAYAALITPGMASRTIETVRTTPAGADFRFAPAPGGQAPGGQGSGAKSTGGQGFGCADGNALSVMRAGPNEVSFPSCSAFPYPLERCPAL